MGCARAPAEPPTRLRATVIRATPDTIEFTSGAIARPCSGAVAALVLEAAATGGPGVLVLLRSADTIGSGTYPLTLLGDSVTVPAAHVAARYVLQDAAHGFALDSGSVELELDERTADARVTGTGLEGGTRVELRAEFRGVRVAGEPAACRVQ